MKAIKTTIAQSGPTLYIKALIYGTLVGTLLLAILLCVVSVMLLVAGTLPQDYLVWISIALCAISTFLSGYVTARVTKSNGMLSGALAGAIMFMILLIAGLTASDETLTYITLIKFAALVLCGAIGGIRAVNRKDKIRIK